VRIAPRYDTFMLKAMSEMAMSNLILPPYAACVFVDDTGHEHLAGTSFYGLGACAVLGCEYDRLIKAYPVDSGSATCCVLNDRIRPVAGTTIDGQRAFAFAISESVF